ncbi:hypothetical protein [Blautia sp.]|uniref:hypothetical protein n=1 Tax=Blautia sp. TaxID=1955243 RepID=UPI0025C696CE|nr:hypothetical protein [Blautia sp.]
MLGIIYCLLAILIGKEVAGMFFVSGNRNKSTRTNQFWILASGALGTGLLIFGWITYMISWAASALGAEKPLIYGNLAVMAGAAVFLALLYGRRYRKENSILSEYEQALIHDKKQFRKELILLVILAVFLTWIMFYVFYIKDGVLYSGYTVYGDYAPHTAMMRSFSLGNNFPTQYPHFGGQDVKYHFMFQFLVGNLEFLGLRLDFAYNIVSILALLAFLMMLYNLALRITGSFAASVMTIVFFFFRSALTFFHFVLEHLQAGDLMETFRNNMNFIGYTPNENWGLWNFNVYLNQRHLAFGLLIVTLALWMFLDWVDAGCAHEEKGWNWLTGRIFSREAWKSRNLENALMAGMMLGLTSFWNGAAVIGGLLILFGFAAFSDGKLDYLVTAIAAVVFAELQAKVFIWGDAVSTSFYWGFLAEDKSLHGVLWFLLQMSGVFFLGALVLLYFLKDRRQRVLLTSFPFPLIFAFCISLTPDIAVNQKYIMISYAFVAMFWGWAFVKLFQKGIWRKLAAVVLAICLTITGIYDFVIIVRDNGPGRRVSVNLNSALTDWLAENLTSEDLILTPEYSINEVTMAGVMMYMGWPYYAWSAGYDTYRRADIAKTIYSSTDENTVKKLVKQEKITYILFEDGMTFEETECREDTIAEAFRLVYQLEDGRIRIYET